MLRSCRRAPVAPAAACHRATRLCRKLKRMGGWAPPGTKQRFGGKTDTWCIPTKKLSAILPEIQLHHFDQRLLAFRDVDRISPFAGLWFSIDTSGILYLEWLALQETRQIRRRQTISTENHFISHRIVLFPS